MREFREWSLDLIDDRTTSVAVFSDEKLQDPSASIRQHGILKRLLVRPNGEWFVLIDGWRQLSAAKAIDRALSRSEFATSTRAKPRRK
jgi:ParB-like chromosome segregation protein Spo0J